MGFVSLCFSCMMNDGNGDDDDDYRYRIEFFFCCCRIINKSHYNEGNECIDGWCVCLCVRHHIFI